MIRSYWGAVCGNAGSYGIVFRDFPGCISAGDSIESVLAMGAEALGGHIEAMQEDGELVPLPSEHTLTDVMAWLKEEDDPSGDAWVGLYPVAVQVKPVSAAFALPIDAGMIHEISAALEGQQEVASLRQFVETAARRELARVKRSA